MLFVPDLLPTRDLGGVRRLADGTYRSRAVDGALVKVRPGVFACLADWERAHPEGRVLAHSRALTNVVAGAPPVISHESAAAHHGLPLYRPDPARVHITVPESRPGAAAGTIRHRGSFVDGDLTVLDGAVVTSLPRTVADVCRTAPFEQAVVVADAALRHVGGRSGQRYDADRASEFVTEVRQIASRSAHGFARACRVLTFADGRAQLPGESISRIRLSELGFRGIRIQVPVPAPGGGDFFVDFACRHEQGEWLGEFDGRLKYTDDGFRAGKDVARIVDEEKRREDWIRGRTGLRLVRWGWSDIDSAQTLATRLAAFGIRPPR